MRWIESFLTVIREGLGQPISLEFLLPHTGKERADILAEVDQVALHHYKLKVLYEGKLRRRFGRARGQSDVDAEDEATQVLLNGVIGEISFGELIQGDADDVAAEETDEDSDQTSSEYESASEDDSSTSSGDSDNDTEESLPEQRPKPPPLTTPALPRTLPPIRTAPVEMRTRPSLDLPRPPAPRQRTLSLKKVRSMNFSLGGQSGSTKRSHDQSPVPPLPPMPQTANVLSKPLPPTPQGTTPRTETQNGTAVPTIVKAKKKNKAKDAITPPDVQLLPQLLPVFTEMVCGS